MFLYPCRLNPQIWNVKKEKERENEKVGDRLAELNEKKSDKELEARDKKTKETNFVGRTKWYTRGKKIRNASGYRVKMRGSEKKKKKKKNNEREHKQQKFLWAPTTFSP